MDRNRHGRHRRSPVNRRRRPSPGYRARSLARFERLVDDALAGLPAAFLQRLDNVQITVAETPADLGFEDEILLGLYQGVPQPERQWGAPMLPDRITLFRKPIEARARTRAELVAIVRDTVVHEVAHHFGIDDDRLDDLGWA